MKKGKLLFSFNQLLPDIVSTFFVTFEPRLQSPERKTIQDNKEDKKLDRIMIQSFFPTVILQKPS